MTKRIYLLAMLVLVLLLSACAADTPVPTATPAEPTITRTPAPTPTDRITPPSPTALPTLPPTETQLVATFTSVPTITPIPPTPMPITPTPTPLSFPTPAAEYFTDKSISPSGKWIAWWVRFDEFHGYQFANQDGSKTWTFTKEDIDKVYDVDYLHEINVAHWSSDNKFVYLTTRPDSWHVHFYPTSCLVKFSLVNGSYSYLLTPTQYPDMLPILPDAYMYYQVGFSNNSQWVAYAIKNGQSIDFTILDLYSGESRNFSVIVAEDAIFGDISWSPNDEFFVFSAAESMYGLDASDDFSVFLVTLEDLSVKRILPHGTDFLYSLEWLSNKEILYSYFSIDIKSGTLVLNIETGEIIKTEYEY